MKKSIGVLLLVVMMVLTMVGCRNTPPASVDTTLAGVNESGKLEFKPKSTYNMSKFGKEFVTYRFDSPNSDIVVYQIPGSAYIVGEDDKIGTSYAKVLIRDSEFVALSPQYILLIIDGEKVAVDIVHHEYPGLKLLKKYPFDDLSEEEKEAFVYPMECEEVK